MSPSGSRTWRRQAGARRWSPTRKKGRGSWKRGAVRGKRCDGRYDHPRGPPSPIPRGPVASGGSGPVRVGRSNADERRSEVAERPDPSESGARSRARRAIWRETQRRGAPGERRRRGDPPAPRGSSLASPCGLIGAHNTDARRRGGSNLASLGIRRSYSAAHVYPGTLHVVLGSMLVRDCEGAEAVLERVLSKILRAYFVEFSF